MNISVTQREFEAILFATSQVEGDLEAAMPFPDNSFKMVVFDPPHLVWAGKAANLYKRFGILEKDWKTELSMGFNECFHVLEDYGVLIFKWSETQLKLKTVLALTNEKPLFGHKRGKTFWVAFMKFPNKNNAK